MAGLFVGPMPVEEFLHEFVPEAPQDAPPLEATHFNRMPKGVKKESEMYQPFIDLIVDHNILPGFQIVDTSNHPDPDGDGWKIKTDPSIYRNDVDTSKKKTQWGEVECHIELKPNDSYDGFRDPRANVTAEGRLEHPFEADAEKRAKTRSQLIHYATEWCSRQHRRFAFTVYIGEPYVRFIRWDRSGAIVSEQFNYRTNSKPLIEFLWRFSHLDDAGRGRDPSVRLATPEEKKLAHKVLLEWAHPRERPVVVFTVPVEDGDAREFIGWGSMAYPESLTGRCTRAYPVFELVNPAKRYFLKDTWRAHDLDPESRTLIELNSKGVEHIPPFLCGGDLTGDATMTDLFVPAEVIDQGPGDSKSPASPVPGLPPRKSGDWRCGKNWTRINRRVHHRFVVDFVGKPLEKVKSSKHLMQVCADAFIAHQQAYELCDYVHRDVSSNNILIDANGRGILNDWDLAKKKSELDRRRRHERTGTWEFMSYLILSNRGTDTFKAHTIQDDMESFVHVLLYYGLRYFPHNKPHDTLQIITDIFHYSVVNAKGVVSGGETKRSMFLVRSHIGVDFEFAAVPFAIWMESAFEVMAEWINFVGPFKPSRAARNQIQATQGDPSSSSVLPHLHIKDHNVMADFFKEQLSSSEWPILDDPPHDCLPELREQMAITLSRRIHDAPSATSGKRSSSAMVSEPGNSDVRSSDGPLKKKSKTYGTAPSTHTMNTRRGGGGSSMGGSSNSRTT